VAERRDRVSDAEAPAVEEETPAGPARDVRRYLPWAGLVLALWATLPKYSGPALTVKGGDFTEFIDHVVPGIVVAIASLAALLAWRRKGEKGHGLVPFAAAAVTLLSGFWMVATHFPLVLQATRGEAPWAGTVYHSTASIAVFGFGLLWTVSHWPDLSDAMAEDDARRAGQAGASAG
jgi:hypothetical protein